MEEAEDVEDAGITGINSAGALIESPGATGAAGFEATAGPLLFAATFELPALAMAPSLASST